MIRWLLGIYILVRIFKRFLWTVTLNLMARRDYDSIKLGHFAL